MNSWRDWKCSRYDILCLSAITIVGGLIRAWGIGTPGGYVLDEFYASDACLYIGGSPSLCRMPQELTIVQPPLGKWLIGSGISLLGFQPTGWRIASVVAGTLTIAALYLLARKVLNSTFAAAVASGLLAIDFLHFVFSRTAMLDVFVTFFIVIAFLFSAYDRERIFRSNRASHQLIWRMAAGTSVGAACASKWSAWPCLVALILLTVTWEFKALQADGRNPTVYKKILKASFSLFLCFVLLPALVYVLSYVGRLSGSLFTWPWAQDSWLRALMERQLMMFSFHVGLSGSHPYTSPAWSWILLKRPVLMYLRQPAEETYRVILGFGSPLVWWVSAAALIYLTLDWVRNRGIANTTSIIFVGFIATYGPWLLLGLRRQQVFLYYLLPTVPFMCLALGAIAALASYLPARGAARVDPVQTLRGE